MKLRNLLTILCTVAAAGSLQAQVQVLGDFEGGDMTGWSAGGSASIAPSTIGATSGTGSLAVSPGAVDFQWGLVYNGPFDPAVTPILSLDVTWVASEWTGLNWLNLELAAMNSDSGWSQVQASDPANPSYPGSWDPVNWGDNTRHLTFDFTGYDKGASSWTQLQIALNIDPSYTGTLGNFYIDNVKLSAVPEPGSLALLGVGGLLLALRRRWNRV